MYIFNQKAPFGGFLFLFQCYLSRIISSSSLRNLRDPTSRRRAPVQNYLSVTLSRIFCSSDIRKIPRPRLGIARCCSRYTCARKV